MTDSIKSFILNKNNGGNPKSKIFDSCHKGNTYNLNL